MASAPPPASDAASASSSPLFTTFRVSKTSKGIENFLLSSTTPSVDLRYQIETPPPAYSVSSRASVSTLIYRGSGDERRRVAAVSWQYPEVLWRFGQGEDHNREEKFQLSDILPQEKWPSKSRVVKLSDDRSWIWSFSTTHLKLVDAANKAPLARYDPAPAVTPTTEGPLPEPSLSVSSSLSLDDLDLVIVGFLAMLHDAEVRGDLAKLEKVRKQGSRARRAAEGAFTSVFGHIFGGANFT